MKLIISLTLWTAIAFVAFSDQTMEQRQDAATAYTKQLATNLLTHISH
jgi:hypothetical protein